MSQTLNFIMLKTFKNYKMLLNEYEISKDQPKEISESDRKNLVKTLIPSPVFFILFHTSSKDGTLHVQ